jgi:catechol 2,3-dioxygenase-like lactoylglutathione lyase family enzyme
MSLDYVMMGTSNLERSRAFYDAVLPCLGGTLDTDIPGYGFSYLFRNGTRLWVAPPYNREAPLPGNGIMPGLRCATRAEIDAAYAAAMTHGGTDEGPPGLRPLYGPTFYGAYVRDPDGNKMSFVHDEPGH